MYTDYLFIIFSSDETNFKVSHALNFGVPPPAKVQRMHSVGDLF